MTSLTTFNITIDNCDIKTSYESNLCDIILFDKTCLKLYKNTIKLTDIISLFEPKQTYNLMIMCLKKEGDNNVNISLSTLLNTILNLKFNISSSDGIKFNFEIKLKEQQITEEVLKLYNMTISDEKNNDEINMLKNKIGEMENKINLYEIKFGEMELRLNKYEKYFEQIDSLNQYINKIDGKIYEINNNIIRFDKYFKSISGLEIPDDSGNGLHLGGFRTSSRRNR